MGQFTFSFKIEPSQVVVLCCLALYCIGLIDLIMYPLSLEIGVIGGLITPAFSYMLSKSFPCLSRGRDVLLCLIYV